MKTKPCGRCGSCIRFSFEFCASPIEVEPEDDRNGYDPSNVNESDWRDDDDDGGRRSDAEGRL
jgi:hypothetical protein